MVRSRLKYIAFFSRFWTKITIDYRPKKGGNAQYYRRVLAKKIDFRGFLCRVLSIIQLVFKITLDYQSKNSKKCSSDTLVQNHSWLSVKTVERREGGREGLEILWHLLGSKSRLILGQKTRKMLVVDFRGREGLYISGGRVSWSIYDTFWD